MTQSFQDILSQHPKGMMQAIYWSTFMIVLVTSMKLKRRLLCIGIIGILLFLSMIIQGEVFYGWWAELEQAAQSMEDEKWLANHDGGRLIVDLSLVAEAIFAGFIATIICLLNTKTKKEEKGITSGSTE